MWELRRMGLLQARNAGVSQPENPFLFNSHQTIKMQKMLPLDRHREHMAYTRLKTIFNQINECQQQLSSILLPANGRDFIRDGRTRTVLNSILNYMTNLLIDMKNVSSGMDAVINLH